MSYKDNMKFNNKKKKNNKFINNKNYKLFKKKKD